MKATQSKFDIDGAAPANPQRCIDVGRTALTALAALAAAVLLALGGCASADGIAPSARLLAPAEIGLAGSATGSTTGAATESAPFAVGLAADWWRGFGDPALDRLVDQALAGSPNLKVVQTRVDRAQAGVSATQAAAGPQVNGSVDVTRQRFSATSIYPPPLGGSIRTLGTLQAGASWEWDLFGRHRAALDAAIGSARAARADLQAARLQIAGQVLRGYVQLGRLFDQRRLAEQALAQRRDILALVDQRVRAGVDSTVERKRGEAALPDARLQIEQIDEQIMLTRHQLAALTGQPPQALTALVVDSAALRPLPLPDALPADLLGRRADIVAARWRVEAAGGEMAAARAQFYPNINLTAFVGLASIGMDRLVQSSSEQYGVGPAIRLPIFDAGRLRANLRARAADVDQAVDGYNALVLDAVRDAADQIGSLRSIERQRAEQAQALASVESAYDLATQRYKAGLSTYLVVLDAESGVLAQRRLHADLQARVLASQVALIQALGGGYAAEAAPPEPARSAAAPSASARPLPDHRSSEHP